MKHIWMVVNYQQALHPRSDQDRVDFCSSQEGHGQDPVVFPYYLTPCRMDREKVCPFQCGLVAECVVVWWQVPHREHCVWIVCLPFTLCSFSYFIPPFSKLFLSQPMMYFLPPVLLSILLQGKGCGQEMREQHAARCVPVGTVNCGTPFVSHGTL